MTCYKMIIDGKVVAVGDHPMKWSPLRHFLVGCSINDAEAIISAVDDQCYTDDWLRKPTAWTPVLAEIKAIDEQEFDELMALLDDGEEITEAVELVQPEETAVDDTEQPETPAEHIMTVAEMRSKITELEQHNAFLEECLMEMSELVYA